MASHYETMFVVSPVLSDEEQKATYKKYTDLLKTGMAGIVHQEEWGLRKLAYPIRKKINAYYYLVEYRSDSALVNKLETEFKRDENILRYLTVRLDKHGVDFNDRKRKGLIGRKPAESAKRQEA